jgi:hypothetical protein
MRLTSKPLAALVVAIMFAGIFFSSAMGWWQTESSKEAALYTEGEFAGQANPADIRGSYTFGDVEKNFGLPAALLVQAFGVQTAEPAAFQTKGLEEMYLESPQEVGTASVRLFVAFYLGLPMDLSTDMYLPESAAAILRTRALNAEQAAYLEAHLVPDLSAEAVQPAGAAPATAQPGTAVTEPVPAATAEHAPSVEEGTIKGKTTFAELLAWGLTVETIEQVLGKPVPAAMGMTVKDFCSENGLNFETIRPALQAELDTVK